MVRWRMLVCFCWSTSRQMESKHGFSVSYVLSWLYGSDMNECASRVHCWHRHFPHLSVALHIKYFLTVHFHLLFSCCLSVCLQILTIFKCHIYSSVFLCIRPAQLVWFVSYSDIKLDFGLIMSCLCILYSTAVWFIVECRMDHWIQVTHTLSIFSAHNDDEVIASV